MRKKVISSLQYMLFLGLGLFLIWFQLKDMSPADKESFTSALKQANYWIVVPIVIMSLFSHLCRSQRWRIMMEPMGFKPKLSNTFCVTMVGYLANAGVPRLGEVLKCTFLSRYEKIPADKLVGTIIVERMFDLICFLAVVGLTFLIEFQVVSGFLKERFSEGGKFNPTKLFMVLGALLVIVLVTRWLFKKYPTNGFVKKVKKIVSGIKEGFLTVSRLKKRGPFFLWTFLMWAMYLLQVYVGFLAMDATAGLNIGASLAVLVLASLAMIITPGGIGAFPLFIMEVLVLYNIGSAYGKAFGWLMWGVSTIIVIVAGLFCLLILPYLNKNYHAQGKRHTA
jgi:uncharacterized membrane protein YbhN (UPF0104 family)